jgi:hypothetical protein
MSEGVKFNYLFTSNQVQQLGWEPSYDPQAGGKHLHWDTLPQDSWVGG